MSQQLEIRERVRYNSIRKLAVDPKRFAVRRDTHAVADVASARCLDRAGFVWELYPSHLLVRRKIHHRESVKFVKVYENPAARAVGATLDRHGAYWHLEINLPNGLLSLDISDLQKLRLFRARDHILAVRRQIDVVQGTFHRDSLDPL